MAKAILDLILRIIVAEAVGGIMFAKGYSLNFFSGTITVLDGALVCLVALPLFAVPLTYVLQNGEKR